MCSALLQKTTATRSLFYSTETGKQENPAVHTGAGIPTPATDARVTNRSPDGVNIR